MTRTEWRMFETMCQEAGRHIDPETAEVIWKYAGSIDPYGINPWEEDLVSREYFARSPGDAAWVHFGDLSPEVSKALWDKHIDRLGTRAGPFLLV